MLSLFEIDQVVLAKILLKISSMYYCYFVIISPWKREGPFLWRNTNPHHPRMFLPSLVEIGPVVLEKKIKMWKIYDKDDNDHEQETIFTRKAHLSLSLRWSNKYSITGWPRSLSNATLYLYGIRDNLNTMKHLPFIRTEKEAFMMSDQLKAVHFACYM